MQNEQTSNRHFLTLLDRSGCLDESFKGRSKYGRIGKKRRLFEFWTSLTMLSLMFTRLSRTI